MSVYVFDGSSTRHVPPPGTRPLRWAAWRPDGAMALLVGNRGESLVFDGVSYRKLETGSAHNLRGVAWSPDGGRALLCGNRGALLLLDGERVRDVPSVTSENLRRVAWSPDGSCALIVGNAGVVLRYTASTGVIEPLPGDRAHTMRSIAWRPDGAYALIGGYASNYAGYPRPHLLYRCDGRYTQGILATDDEDDAVAISYRPGDAARATVLSVAWRNGVAVRNKLFVYDGGGFVTQEVESSAPLLGFAWHPGGGSALLCGARGTLLRLDDKGISTVPGAPAGNLVGPFWRPDGSAALLLRGPEEKVYTA